MSWEEAAHNWVQTFVNQCKTGTKAELRLYCEGEHLKVTVCADLGRFTAKTRNFSDCWGVPKWSPSRVRRRERRIAERASLGAAVKVAAGEVTAEKADAEKATPEEVVAEKVATEEVVAEKVVEKAIAEEVIADNAAAEAEQGSAEKEAAGKDAAENKYAEKEAFEKEAAEKEAAVKEDAEASTSLCGRKQQAMMPCWSCDEMFATDDEGFIPEHFCAKTLPVHSPKGVRPGPKPPMVFKKPVRMLDGSPVWSPRPK